jgi:hypothetical protein
MRESSKKDGMFLTLKQLNDLGIISLDKDHILVKKKKRKHRRKRGLKPLPGLDYNMMKSQSVMPGGGVSHQLRTI